MHRLHVLLFSGWQTINIGDIGHTPGTLAYLERFWPEADVTLWLSQTNEAVTGMLRRRFPRVPIVAGQLNSDGQASTPELQAAFESCDLLIQNSGMHFNRFWGCPVNLLDACARHGKPLCLYGQSFDGIPAALRENYAARLSEPALITARETTSLAFLREQGVQPRGGAEFGPDGCFGIDVRDDERAGAFLASHGLGGSRFITVTIRTNTPKLGAVHGDVLNPVQPTPEQQAQDERWAAALRAIIVDYLTTTDGRVLLAPEVDKEIAPARRLLREPLAAELRGRVVWRDQFWNVDEAASVYARAEAVVSMEPHSCIIALANGVPTLHVFSPVHGVKAAMFADLGAPEWLIDIDAAPNDAVTALRAITQDPAAAGAKALRLKRNADTRSGEVIAKLRGLVAA